MKKATNKLAKNAPGLLMLLGSAFILRIILAQFGTLTLDQNTFIAWGRMLATSGFKTFYSNWSDYLPGYLYVLAFLAKLEPLLPIPQTVLYKLPAIFADLAVGGLVYKITSEFLGKERRSHKWGLIAAALVLFNPAVLYNSTLWGQVDMITALFAILAIYLFPKNFWASALCLSLGALVKPQAALAAPVILFLMYRAKTPFLKAISYVGFAGVLFLAGFLPFFNGPNIITFAAERLGLTVSQYPYGSVNAFNFWAIWGFWQKENTGILSINRIGLFLFGTATLVGFFKHRKDSLSHYFILTVLLLSNFLFFTRMHERHLLPALIPLAVLVPAYPVLVIPYFLLSLTYVLNMYYSATWITQNFTEVFSEPAVGAFIFLNLVSLLFILSHHFFDKWVKKLTSFLSSKKSLQESVLWLRSFFLVKEEPKIPPSTLPKKKVTLLLLSILIFAFVSRVLFLENPDHEYFDEVYHAFTARVMLHGDKKAWEWWNENPQGFAYEWTHPPFAKEAMVIGMLVFGENSFGWRIPAALFGTAAVFLIYKIASHLFNEEVGLISASAFALDGLSLTMSRIGMNDIYLVCFLLLTLLLFLKGKYLFAGFSLGFAAASKWTTLWFVPVLVATFILLRKKVKKSLLFIFILPFILYVVSYIPMFLTGHDWEIFWGVQKQMWWYHTGLVATHPYSSRWWTWPLLLRPIWLYTSGAKDGMIANIYGFGNPAIFWGGLIAVCTSIYYALVEKRKHLLLILAGYFGLFAPWALSPRIMFFYHYFPAVPFLCIALGFVLYRNKKYLIPFFVIALVLYLYFYPHWTGISIPVWLDNSYYWLPGWR